MRSMIFLSSLFLFSFAFANPKADYLTCSGQIDTEIIKDLRIDINNPKTEGNTTYFATPFTKSVGSQLKTLTILYSNDGERLLVTLHRLPTVQEYGARVDRKELDPYRMFLLGRTSIYAKGPIELFDFYAGEEDHLSCFSQAWIERINRE
jgi:hypothetical protein